MMTIPWLPSPNTGDTVEGPRGEIWEWDGDKWVSLGGAPPGPQQGDVRFDSGKLEQWDGTAWQEIPLGGGPQMGVTDGSEAAPGEVGEHLEVFQGFNDMGPISTNGGYLVASLTLPPGDWDIQARAHVFINFSGAITTGLDSFGITVFRAPNSPTSPPALIQIFTRGMYNGSGSHSAFLTTPVFRATSSAPQTLDCWADAFNYWNNGSGPVPGTTVFTRNNARIRARRVR